MQPAVKPEVREALDLLTNAAPTKRISGAKRLRKLADPAAGPPLLAALENELAQRKPWESRYHMILALGFTGARGALPFLWKASAQTYDSTILYNAFGDAIVRLSAKKPGVNKTLAQVLATGNYMLMDGAFRAVAMLRLVPDDATFAAMIAVARSPQAALDVGGFPDDDTGVRRWLAAAAAGCKPALVKHFLEECRGFSDVDLQQTAADSLRGKYGKQTPY